ncbi:MAG: hypothetical protein M3Q42_08550 [Pseudomonadota bacterium]|nr:hypothetical protein [Pseudomonadota bacterium]
MLSADELIQALQRRLRLVSPHMRREAGEFPHGWQLWLESQRERPGRIIGAPAASLVAVLAQRSLRAPPRRQQDLTRWQAFSTMWRQHWQPAAREDRGSRVFAAAVSVLSHILFAVLLLWLTYVQISAAPPPEGEQVVQVELIGTGSPEEAGGGEPAEAAEPAQAAQAEPAGQPATVQEPLPEQLSPAPEVATSVQPPADAPAPALPPVEVAPPAVSQPEPVPVEQAVDVSEPVPDPEVDFVLTPRVPQVSEPDVRAPDLSASVPSVQVVEIPVPLPSAPAAARAPRIVAPELSQQVPEIVRRDIPRPLRAPSAAVVDPAVASPQLQARVPEVRTARIPSPPTPEPATATPEAARAAVATVESAAAADAAAQPPRQENRGTPSIQGDETPQPGAGPKPTPAPGGWPTLKRADDWGDAARNRPGAQRGDDGLYNSDGSVRLADSPGSVAPGEPPGTVTEEIVNLDRAGTWLKRPPIDYEPTAFDRYWRPNETLLEEWVRKSIKTVRIPIPGTNKHIVCQTVLLALGGGCGISDPDLNEQSATARPPPDIPFKPELQEDNGSIRPPPNPGGASSQDGPR